MAPCATEIDGADKLGKAPKKDWRRPWALALAGGVLLGFAVLEVSRPSRRRALRWGQLDLLVERMPDATEVSRHLLAAAAERNSTLSIVQVGGCDGDWSHTNDPMGVLLPDARVHAVVLEPVPWLFSELSQRLAALPQAAGRLAAEHAALCDTDGFQPFYVVSERYGVDFPKAPHWSKKQLGSFLWKHLKRHRIPDKYIEEIQVPCVKPASLLGKPGLPIGTSPAGIDVLMVDAEGLDAKVVKGFLAVEEFQPSMVIFEKKNLPPAELQGVVSELQSRGYATWPCGDNHAAVSSKVLGKIML